MANIYRVQKNSNYVVMNKTSLKDERLSWKAKGLHAYMLSLPDDWKFYDTELQKHAKDGRDSLRTALKELRDLGYLKRVQHRNEDGTFNYETLVFEIPQTDPPLPGKPLTDYPLTGKPLTDYPSTENPTLLSTDQLSTDLLNTDKNSSSSEGAFYQDIKKFQKVSQFYQENFHPSLSPFNAQCLSELVDKTSSDIVVAAMQTALKEDNKKISFIEGIINKWLDANVTTVDEARKFEREWQARKKGMNAGGKAGTKVSDIRRYNGRSPQKSSYEQALAESAAAKAVW